MTTLAGAPVVGIRETVPRIPASNEKLPTELAALVRLGPSFRFWTTVVAPGTVRNGVLRGSLYLVGGGDPLLSTRARSRAFRARVATVEDLALLVRRAGITRITGRVIADGALFDAVRGGPGWKPGFLPYECAPLSALALDHDEGPGGYAWKAELTTARAFAAALKKRGIRVGKPAATGTAPAGARLVAGLPSPPLATVIRLMGKDSDNFVAETVAKDIGAYGEGAGSTAVGAAAIRGVLAARSVPLAGVRIVDGSGLSLDDRTTTRTLAGTLVAAARDRTIAAAMRDSLAIAGVDGTLIHRMTTGPARGVVRAKTGTLNEASSLSGYAGRYAFSVIVNAPSYVDITKAHDLQDAIAQLLAGR